MGINKMDSCNWSETRFNEISDEIKKMITSAGYKASRVPIIPFSGFHGENLIKQTDKMPWYKGWEVPVSKTEKVSGVHFTMHWKRWHVHQNATLKDMFVFQ